VARRDGPPEGRADREQPADPGWARRLLAEVVGTFALVFVAAGGDVTAQVSGGDVSSAARAAAPGLMVAAMIYSIGDASGAHFNPVVTLAFGMKRLVPAVWLPAYWVAQLVGALTAAGLLAVLFPGAIDAGVSRPKLVDAPTTIAIEAVLTLLLVTVILGTADRFRVVGPDAAFAVGATIALCGLIALPIEGASMNPARSLGPAIVAQDLSDAPLYVVGPVIGAVLAVLLTSALHGRTDRDAKSEEAARGGGSRR